MIQERAIATRRPVSLAAGNDAVVAERLREYLRDAADGVRRIAIAGAYCEWIVQQLPHGKLGHWLAEHCPDVVEQTVRKWRQFSRSLFEAAKRVHGGELTLPPHELLSAAVDDLSAEAREVRSALDDLLAGKTYRQLWFEFKQLEEGPDGELHVKHGRLKGCEQVRTPQSARADLEERRVLILNLLNDWAAAGRTLCDHEDLGLVDDGTAAMALESGIGLNNKLRLMVRGKVK